MVKEKKRKEKKSQTNRYTFHTTLCSHHMAGPISVKAIKGGEEKKVHDKFKVEMFNLEK